jgi:hypothetical protein
MAPSTLKLGVRGRETSPGPNYRYAFGLAKFLPSTVPHSLGKHHTRNRNSNNDNGGYDDENDGDEDGEDDKDRGPRTRNEEKTKPSSFIRRRRKTRRR